MTHEAEKLLELIEEEPYGGVGLFCLACEIRALKNIDWHLAPADFNSLARPYIQELKRAGLIYHAPSDNYDWIATRYRTLNEDFDNFTANGKVRSLLRALRISSIEELTKMRAVDLLKMRNIGVKTITDLSEDLERRGLALAEHLPITRCPHCGHKLRS